METLVYSIGIQIVWCIGLLYGIGLVSHIISSVFYVFINRNALIINTIGFFGIPFHELSHAIFAVLFRHRILKVSLFEHDSEGISGQVLTNYDRNNLYQKIGLFFIGTGPILIGILLILFIMRLFIPEIYHELSANYVLDSQYESLFFYIIDHLRAFYTQIKVSIGKAFVGFIVISIAIALPMSKEDLQASFKGLPYLLLILISINTILFIISPGIVNAMTEYVMEWSKSFLNIYVNLIMIIIPLLIIIAIIYRAIVYFKK